jgi:uncharacterized MnhB-related membrane protein
MELTPVLTGVALTMSVACGAAAVTAPRVLAAGLWLAASSACLAIGLFLFGAPDVAVIELSVGAGLVAVLVVFTVASSANDGLRARSPIPEWLAVTLAALVIGCLGLVVLAHVPGLPLMAPAGEQSFARVFWQERGLDALGQLALLFVAALSVVVLVGHVALPGATRNSQRVEVVDTDTARDLAEVRV